MKRRIARFNDASDTEIPVRDITPDLADNLVDALTNGRRIDPPVHATSFNELTATIAQTTRVIQHLTQFRELAILAADRTSPHADRKAIGIAAALSPSRLYRLLDKLGQPSDRRAVEPAPNIGDLNAQLDKLRRTAASPHLSGDQRARFERQIDDLEALVAELGGADAQH